MVQKITFVKLIFNITLPSRNFERFANSKSLHKKSLIHKRNMPKNNTASVEIIEAKVKNASPKKTLFAPSEIYLCVLGNGASNSSRALYMFTDHGRYLFNCGEGTQRLAHEYKMKLSKLDHIFITYKNWRNLGGLLGLSLTIQEMGLPEINLHGPPGTDSLYKHADSFVVTKDLKIVNRDIFEKGFVDGCMQITYIPVGAVNSFEEEECVNTTVESEGPVEQAKKIRKENESEPIDLGITVAYACKGHSKPGQLLIEKCVEQGVPPGPLLGDLKNGKDVVLPCGKIVYSKDVVSEEQPCPLFLVVECPSEPFIENFVTEKKFKKYQTGTSLASNIAALVVHFTPPEVLKTRKYQEWMEKFPDTTCHLILNSDNATVCSSAIHRIQHKLNLLHPHIFPTLQEKEIVPLGELEKENLIQANTLDRFLLRPNKGLDRSLAVKINPQVFIDEALNTEGFQDCLANLKICIQETSDISPFYGNPYPEVFFLGTGSCIPSKVRNVSSILVRVCKFEYFLLDCGEGTTGQLMRMLGSQYESVMKGLIGVFISHMHADHHLGLIQLLKARETAYEDEKEMLFPLFVIGPQKLDTWLRKYNENFEKISPLYSFINASTREYGYGKYTEDGEVARLTFYDLSISTVPVNHCPDAYALIMTDKFVKWKLVYSGDTIPCEKLVIAGKNCTLLIHEATMEDELADEAALKRHSTTSQAVEISEKMKASHTILTHFSQRYAKVPLINENFNNQVGCAFDNMRASRKEYPILPLLIPALKCLFAEHVQELKTKGDKRRKRQELISQMGVE